MNFFCEDSSVCTEITDAEGLAAAEPQATVSFRAARDTADGILAALEEG